VNKKKTQVTGPQGVMTDENIEYNSLLGGAKKANK
jgi:hypothetical protein